MRRAAPPPPPPRSAPGSLGAGLWGHGGPRPPRLAQRPLGAGAGLRARLSARPAPSLRAGCGGSAPPCPPAGLPPAAPSPRRCRRRRRRCRLPASPPRPAGSELSLRGGDDGAEVPEEPRRGCPPVRRGDEVGEVLGKGAPPPHRHHHLGMGRPEDGWTDRRVVEGWLRFWSRGTVVVVAEGFGDGQTLVSLCPARAKRCRPPLPKWGAVEARTRPAALPKKTSCFFPPEGSNLPFRNQPQ